MYSSWLTALQALPRLRVEQTATLHVPRLIARHALSVVSHHQLSTPFLPRPNNSALPSALTSAAWIVRSTSLDPRHGHRSIRMHRCWAAAAD
jgi:hypothetical protein